VAPAEYDDEEANPQNHTAAHEFVWFVQMRKLHPGETKSVENFGSGTTAGRMVWIAFGLSTMMANTNRVPIESFYCFISRF
jgi:hypothetical protein